MSHRILVVDDEKEFTQVIAQMLNLRGFTAIEANSGQEALGILSKEKVDLMTLDLSMPGMDGILVAKAVNAQWPDIKIVVVTGFGSDYDDQLKYCKIDKVLPKPVPIMDLIATIKEVIG